MPPKSLITLIVNIGLIAVLVATNWTSVAAQEPELLRELAPTQPAVETHDVTTWETISAAATSIRFPSDDAPVREGAPNSTAPNEPYLGAGYDDGSLYGTTGRVRSYLRFDLSSLPSDSTITSATLRLRHAGGQDYPGQSRTITFYRVTGSWGATSLTWNNRPSYAEAVGSVSTTYNLQDWVSLDVTNLVRAWVSGSQPNYGLVAIGPESAVGIYRAFFSSEDIRSPELQISYFPPQPPVLDVWPGARTVKASTTQSSFTASIQVSDVTYGSLDWSATKVGSAAWLSLSNPTGNVTPTTPDDLVLNINPFGLAPGIYTEQVQISSNTPNVVGSPMTATVSLEVFDHLSNIYLPVILKSGSSSAPQIVALLVGISDYQYLDPPPSAGNLPDGWGFDLYAPKYDVQDMARWLSTMGVAASNIIQRTESQASRASIVNAFNELDQKENKDSTVIFYYSGHGGQVPDLNGDESDGEDEFIAAYDTELVEISPGVETYLRVLTDDDLYTLLANLESEHIVIVIDSCFSGGLLCCDGLQATSVSPGLLRRGLAPLAMLSSADTISTQAAMCDLIGPGRVVISGGTGDQSTWESQSLGNGVFTYFFLQALQDATNDANQNDWTSAEEAYWFSRDVVDDWVSTHVISDTIIHQNPDIDDQYFGQVGLTWFR